MTKQDNYIAALREIDIRLEKGGDLYADLGNVAAALKKRCAHFYWVGFYFLRSDRLALGPFQGTPACVFLELNGGVCAACASENRSITVPDVSFFPGHVACDPQSKSEIAVPCRDEKDELRAVLDVDSSQIHAFDEIDRQYLETIANRLKPLWRNKNND